MLKRVCLCFITVFACSIYADEVIGDELPLPASTPEVVDNTAVKGTSQVFDFGVGFGLDYGGIVGIKLAGIALEHLGFFAAGGFYLFTFGWNLGLQGYFLPTNSKKVFRPYAQLMYGVNCGTMVLGADEYNKVFYGLTPGVGAALRFGSKKKHGFDINLNFPLRSEAFKNQMDEIKNDPVVATIQDPLPVQFSIGYHFSL